MSIAVPPLPSVTLKLIVSMVLPGVPMPCTVPAIIRLELASWTLEWTVASLFWVAKNPAPITT
jgi:hypothetical protein